MIFMFELFNEAGRRLPRALGQTVSVVGGLIIGDAAIRAGITSPTIIVTVAISVISSYILVNTVLSGATAQIRIGMLIISSILGLFGFMIGLFALLVHLVSLECYGVSYLSPVSPYIPGDFTQAVSMPPSMKKTSVQKHFTPKIPLAGENGHDQMDVHEWPTCGVLDPANGMLGFQRGAKY
ncbi:spore germination protein [Paenibacillus amylolyticus]|nr:spore germination protein [Paenibacillus amylolyticus]